MKTIDDAVRDLNGALPLGGPDDDFLVFGVHSEEYWLQQEHELRTGERPVCTRDEFNRRAVEMGYKGQELEARWSGEWVPCELIANHDGQNIYAVRCPDVVLYVPLHDNEVRPRKTERERWIEAAFKAAQYATLTDNRAADIYVIASDIYDAGLAKTEDV